MSTAGPPNPLYYPAATCDGPDELCIAAIPPVVPPVEFRDVAAAVRPTIDSIKVNLPNQIDGPYYTFSGEIAGEMTEIQSRNIAAYVEYFFQVALPNSHCSDALVQYAVSRLVSLVSTDIHRCLSKAVTSMFSRKGTFVQHGRAYLSAPVANAMLRKEAIAREETRRGSCGCKSSMPEPDPARMQMDRIPYINRYLRIRDEMFEDVRVPTMRADPGPQQMNDGSIKAEVQKKALDDFVASQQQLVVSARDFHVIDENNPSMRIV